MAHAAVYEALRAAVAKEAATWRGRLAEVEGARADAEASLEAARAEASDYAREADAAAAAQAAAADEAVSGKLELIAAEGLARKLRFALHVEGREGLQAAALCRQGVKELVGVQQQIAATLGAMEAGEK